MDKTFHLQIATADGAVVDEQVTLVSVLLTDGEMGILANHAAMIAALKEGPVRYIVDGTTHIAAVSGGVLSIDNNEVIILSRSAEHAEDIDIARAKASEERARSRLESKTDEFDHERAMASLYRSLSRQKAYSMLNK